MKRRAPAALVLACLTAAAVADTVLFDEHGVCFGDDGATYALIHRDKGVERTRVYRTADGSAITRERRSQLEREHTPAVGHVRVGEIELRGYGGRTLLAKRGRIVVRVREHLEPRRPDERAAVIQLRSSDGDVHADVMLSDLMDERVRRQLPRSISSVSWFDRAWIDASTGQCVILAGGKRSWAVGLRDGALSEVTEVQLVAGVRRDDAADALHSLYKLTLRGETAPDRLVELARDESVGEIVRSHALAELAARDGSEEQLLDLLNSGPVHWTSLLALTRPIPRRPLYPYANSRRFGAARLLGMGERKKDDVYALVMAAADEDDAFAAAAVAALTRRECGRHRRSLRRLLAEQPRHARALGDYYAEHRDLRAVPLLVDALEAAMERKDRDAADALVAALRKQTGMDAGRDAAGWRRWLDR